MHALTLLVSLGATAARWLEQYGYAGLAIGVFLESAGVPVPGEAALIAASFAAAHGTLSLPLVMLTAAVAGILGDNLGYVLGQRLGRPWAERHGKWIFLTPARLARVDDFFVKRGPVAVTVARFVVGVRVAAAFAAGMSRMPWPVFLRYNVLGAILWAVTTGAAGFALGRSWRIMGSLFGHAQVVLVVFLASLLLALSFRPARAWWVQRDEEHWTRRLASRWVWSVLMSTAATLVLAKVAEDVSERESAAFDYAVRDWALGHHSPFLDTAVAAATWLGSGVVLVPMALVSAGWLVRRGERALAAVTLAAPAGAALAILSLKWMFHRARPRGAAALGELGYSFPSGHTTAVSAIALTVAFVFYRERIGPRWMPLLAVALALLVGVTRIYLDVHWATDVIGGWSAGLLIATGTATLYEWLRMGTQQKSDRREKGI